MENNENQQFEISRNLEQLNHKINILQDAMLKIQDDFSVMRKEETKEKVSSQLSLAANKNKLCFLEKRPSECKIAIACSLSLEQGVHEIVNAYIEKGAESSLKVADRYLKRMEKTDNKTMGCIDGECLKNYWETFQKLRDLINESREASLRHAHELEALNNDSIFEDGVEDEIYALLTPLSNEIRLKIMNDLRKGGKPYSVLETHTGIKAGHLRFHLEKLINGGYVTKEKKNYILTLNGLKVLKFLFELRAELIVPINNIKN